VPTAAGRRAGGERCSCANPPVQTRDEHDAEHEVAGGGGPGEEEVGPGDADRDVHDARYQVSREHSPAGSERLAETLLACGARHGRAVCPLRRSRTAGEVWSVRPRTYPRRMVLGIVVFGAAFLVGLGLGTYTRRPLSTAFFVVGSFTALLLLSATGQVFGAAATLVIVFLIGLVAESVRETFSLLVRS